MGIEKPNLEQPPKIETEERAEQMPVLPDTMQGNAVAALDNEYKAKGGKVVDEAMQMLDAQPSLPA